MKVLALAAYPIAGASTRFRVAQYIEPLRARGIEVSLLTHLSDRGFAALYKPGVLRKARAVLGGALREAVDALAIARDADLVWVQREASLIGPEYLERFLALSGRRLVFDVDDAIWLKAPEDGAANPRWARRLRSATKAERLLRAAQEVIVGSGHLAEHARRHARAVTVVPTVVSREEWTPSVREDRSPLVLGWVGSHSTAPFLAQIAPALRELQSAGHVFELRVVGAQAPFTLAGARVVSEPFELAREVDAVRAFDVGLAPMPAGPWTDGKCGFKQLQYMALGIPCVTSPWAGAKDFVRPDENALVCHSHDEWKAALVRMLTDAALRRRIGQAGRALVEAEYCAERQVDRVATVLGRAAS